MNTFCPPLWHKNSIIFVINYAKDIKSICLFRYSKCFIPTASFIVIVNKLTRNVSWALESSYRFRTILCTFIVLSLTASHCQFMKFSSGFKFELKWAIKQWKTQQNESWIMHSLSRVRRYCRRRLVAWRLNEIFKCSE